MRPFATLKARIKERTPTRLWALLYSLRHNGSGNVRSVLNRIRGRRALLNLRKSREGQIADYIANNPIRKLQLGAGSNDLPGWLNSEGFAPSSFTHSMEIASRYILLDVCETFPFEDSTFDYIFHEHVLEHLDYGQGQFMLNECHRVLKPGGRIRVATPDLQVFVGLYGSQASPEQRVFLNEYVRFNSEVWSTDLAHVRKNHAVFVLNHNFRAWGHHLYTTLTLSQMPWRLPASRKSPGTSHRRAKTPIFVDSSFARNWWGFSMPSSSRQ